jgi:hypothetical protein
MADLAMPQNFRALPFSIFFSAIIIEQGIAPHAIWR